MFNHSPALRATVAVVVVLAVFNIIRNIKLHPFYQHNITVKVYSKLWNNVNLQKVNLYRMFIGQFRLNAS